MRVLRSLFLMLLVTALVWAAVVWQWQRTGRAIEPRDVLMYMVALPLVVIVGFLALRWAWRRADQAQRSATQPSAPGAAAGAGQAPGSSEQERLLVMRVLGYGAVLPGADDAAAALELASEPPTIKVDAELRDRDGLGVFTRRCEGLEPADLEGAPAGLRGSALARSLALGNQCVEAVLRGWPAPDEAEGSEVAAGAARAPKEWPLHLLWAVDEAGSAAERAVVERFVGMQLPVWSAQTPGLAWQLELAPVRNGEALLLQAERRLVMAHRQGREEAVLVVAAQSMLDERIADRLDAEGRLFTASRGQGVMLGEGAAALLLAPPPLEAGAAAAGTPAPFPEARARLHRLSAQRRGKSADEAGRITGDTLAEAMRQALAVAPELMPEALPLVVADTDSQRARVNELLQALQAVLPALQMAEQCRRVGLVAGWTGLAAAPLTLTLAAAHAHTRCEPVFALTQADPHDRLAALVTPPLSPQEADAPAPPA